MYIMYIVSVWCKWKNIHAGDLRRGVHGMHTGLDWPYSAWWMVFKNVDDDVVEECWSVERSIQNIQMF